MSQQSYYESYRFAEVFAQLKRAPDSIASRISEIPGVGTAEFRVVADVTLDATVERTRQGQNYFYSRTTPGDAE
jgi:hypothetical protein